MAKTSEGLVQSDLSRCLACRGCVLACAIEHSESKTLTGALGESPRPQSRVSLVAVDGAAVPLQCRHCEDAPCVAVCPTQAIEKLGPNQPVLITDERCIGCKLCMMVCPFGVVSLRRDGKVALKCDLCLHRLEAGEMPACVTACPTGALTCPNAEDVAAERLLSTARTMVEAHRSAKADV